MYLKASSDFSTIEWDDPADGDQDWWLDRTHCSVALPPLPAEMFSAWIEAGLHAPAVTVNGYLFMSSEAEPRPRELDAPPVQSWDAHAPHLVHAPCLAIRNRDYDDGEPAAALAALEAAIAESSAAFTFTMDIAGALFPLFSRMGRLCKEVIGEGGVLEAATIAGGGGNVTLESASALEALAVQAEADREVAELVRRGDLPALRTRPAAAAFVAAFDDCLERFGWRCQEWTDLHRPTWADEPHIPLALVARYLDAPDQRPSVAFARAAAARESAIARVEAALAGTDKIGEFRSLLASMDGAERVIEERSHWQMLLFAALRSPAMALGRALATAGLLDRPDDALYLSRVELRAVVSGEIADARTIVVGRRADLAAWEPLHAPISIGKSGPRTTPPSEPGSASREAANDLRRHGSRVITGVGVSRGIVTGRARVAASLEDAESTLEPGDILVCRTTSPPWTPLFAVVGGIVTDGGGMLSHPAITAREYGIPAVTNTGHGSIEIADGATVTVDGAAGTVVVQG